MNKIENLSLSRRGFLKASGIATGGLVIGTSSVAHASKNELPKDLPYAKDLQVNAYLQVTNEGEILYFVPNVEMGQGALMGLSTLVAEELDMSPNTIKTKFAGAHKAYNMPGSPIQITGGSATIKARYIETREMAASLRELMITAAAKKLNVAASELVMCDGMICHGENKHALKEFIEEAKQLPIPDGVGAKSAAEFKWIGKDKTPRNDAIAKVTGTAEFGIDVQVPDAKVATVKLSPVIGGTVKSFDDTEARKVSGVKHVVEIKNGVAVVADSYWQARKAADKLKVEWVNPEWVKYSSKDIEAVLAKTLEEKKGKKHFKSGEGVKALKTSAKTIKSEYRAPYLAHATMEPMNCTVQIKDGKLDLWAPTQAPAMAEQLASDNSGISRANIEVHTTFLGGGFGRRGFHDYVEQAVQIAVRTNETIKLVWSREDDMQNGYYRPISFAQYEAGFDEQDNLNSWNVKRAGPNIFPYVMDEGMGSILPEKMPNGLVDWMGDRAHFVFNKLTIDPLSIEGVHSDYKVENKDIRHISLDPGIRTGFWRSVGHSFAGFFTESFIDELAHEVKVDPLKFRLRYLEEERLKNVLKIAAENVNWEKRNELGENRFLGLAAHKSFGSYVAEVAEVSVDSNQIKVHKVTCVVDCGITINPDIVKAQMESGIIFGLSAALQQKITIKDGAVQESNFHDYPILRMNESPEIDVTIVESQESPTGVGEPGTPPIAPAVANAVFAATGQRLKELPLKLA